MKTWDWTLQYIIAIFLSLLLGAILGSISLFETTNLGDTRLTASAVVQFVGYGIALLWFWLLAYRVSIELPSIPKIFSFLRHIILPFATTFSAISKLFGFAPSKTTFTSILFSSFLDFSHQDTKARRKQAVNFFLVPLCLRGRNYT